MNKGILVCAVVLSGIPAVCLGLGEEDRAANLMIVIDSSSSMSELTEDGETRLTAIKAGISSLVGELSKKLNVGLMVFGNRGKRPGSTDIQIVVPVAPLDPAIIRSELDQLKPKGMTPLAAALEMAAQQIAGRKGRSCILVVTDGKETCGGDPIGTARMIRDTYKTGVVIDIVGLNVNALSRDQLSAVAKAGGGEYHDVESSPGMLVTLPRVLSKRTVSPARSSRTEAKKKGAAETNKGKDVVGGSGLGVLIVKYSEFTPRSLTMYDQETKKKVSGGHMWAHQKGRFKTYLKPGVYMLEAKASRGYENMRVRNIVVKSGRESIVQLK